MHVCIDMLVSFHRTVLRSVRSPLSERVAGDEVAWALNGIVCDLESAVWVAVKKGKR